MGTHLRVLNESFPMNTNTTGFSWLSKIFVLSTKVASALEGLSAQLVCSGVFIDYLHSSQGDHWETWLMMNWSAAY